MLRLVAEGYRSPEIAQRLYLAQETVKGHMKETRRRLGARSQAHAVMLAVRRGLL